MNKWPEGAGTYPLGASPQKVRQSVSGTELAGAGTDTAHQGVQRPAEARANSM